MKPLKLTWDMPRLKFIAAALFLAFNCQASTIIYSLTNIIVGVPATNSIQIQQVMTNNVRTATTDGSYLYVGRPILLTGTTNGLYTNQLNGGLYSMVIQDTFPFSNYKQIIFGVPYNDTNIWTIEQLATNVPYLTNIVFGVTQIVAGANVTLSPSTGIGAVTIAATGGGGSFSGNPNQFTNALSGVTSIIASALLTNFNGIGAGTNAGPFSTSQLSVVSVSSVATNVINANSQSQTVNGVNNFSVDQSGVVRFAALVPTTANTLVGVGPVFEYYNAGSDWLMMSGTGGFQWVNHNNSTNLMLLDNGGNLTLQNPGSAVNASNFNGGTFTGNGGGLTNLLHTNMNGMVYVTPYDFGAIGNGTTDDTAAIQSWVTYGWQNHVNLYAPVTNNSYVVFKLTSAIKSSFPAASGNGQFQSWKWIGDGSDAVTFYQSNTNADIFDFTNTALPVSGFVVDGFGFKGSFTGANACITRAISIPSGTGNNNNLFINCSFNYMPTAMYLYTEDSVVENCIWNDCLMGSWLPNTGNGNNNNVIINCESTEGVYASAIGASTNVQVGIRIDGGQGHQIIGCSMNSLASTAGSAAYQFRGATVVMSADYAEMGGGAPEIDGTSVITGANNNIQLQNVTGITGGALSNTNQYPVICGTNSVIELIGFQNFQGWGSKSPYKLVTSGSSAYHYITGAYNQYVTVDEFLANGTYRYTYLITPSQLTVANGFYAATNAITALGQSQLNNGVTVFSVDYNGNVVAKGTLGVTGLATHVNSTNTGTLLVNGGAGFGSTVQVTGNLTDSAKITTTNLQVTSAAVNTDVIAEDANGNYYPTNAPVISGANITSLNATQLTSGTVPVAQLPIATASTVGAVSVDNTTIAVTGGGQLSVIGGGGGSQTPWTNSINGAGYNLTNAQTVITSNHISGNISVSNLNQNSVVVTQGGTPPSLASSITSSTELSYVHNVTSSIQTQLNAKGSGTVTSVTFTGDGVVDSSTPSSAVTTTGTVAATIINQTSNTFLAGPTSGSAAAPTFRALNGNDLVGVNGAGLTNLNYFPIRTNRFFTIPADLLSVTLQAYAAFGSSNVVYGVVQQLSDYTTISNNSFKIQAGQTGAHYGFAIYSIDGGTKLLDTGAVQGVSGATIKTAVGPLTLAPGFYLVCSTCDSTTPTLDCWTALGNTIYVLNSSQTNIFSCANPSVAGAMPSTLGALTPATPGNNFNVPFQYWGW